MIVIKLQGGLGNQMFQYAVARNLAIKNQSTLVLDLSFLKKTGNLGYTLRDYELRIFNINAARNSYYGGENIFSKFLIKLRRVKIINEHSPLFEPTVLMQKGNVYLNGFWQSEKYFIDIKKNIIEDFSFQVPSGELNVKYSAIINGCDAISLHVRRGDYVTSGPTYHNLCSLNYYQDAIGLVVKHLKNPVFFIFSDDISWVKFNLVIPHEHYFMTHNTGRDSFMDMYLMSLCKHNILANSSFSWWGAWLNSNASKIVIAPKQWFNNPLIDTSDIIPERWIRI